MKDQALEIAQNELTDQAKTNRLREYLQHVLLRQLFERDLLDGLVFHGGTALRVVHGLARFSEDLDFHRIEPDPKFDLAVHLEDLRKDLERSGYTVILRPRLEKNVRSCMFGFDRLLFESGLSAHENQKLNIKVEVDINPPARFQLEKTLINTYFPFVVNHHDRPTFIAGKLHAILQRRFAKGRDFYDLMFYLSRWKEISPNIPYLNNALEQTGYSGEPVTGQNWKQVTSSRVRTVNWSQIEKDVEPFLLRPEDRQAFSKEMLLQLLIG